MDRARLGEALVGLVVVAVAAAFFAWAWGRTQGGPTDRYPLIARFPNVAGVAVGSDVRLAGIKVGRVEEQRLDPATWEAVLVLSVDRSVRLPADSSAAITSAGLLGDSFVALVPGAEQATLGPGDEIVETQGATDLMGLVGAVLNRSGGASAAP
ncbi:MAG: outer membrane lipid asymmetry maintenance protein MlaD [Sphingomonadaceae bacterium]|uniref:outer membrane lipid asymmetry maintenance protein MlaD n=1 Tax=Thermaurantiacus sp. TaxID=2820283 RepID=UPI00298EE54A|nr:outer membrane lipid asymmetry maintenance protein MlaD [Thermaurantiacus sp.]MCS6986155.1 outer membrane lipid asymmetry maintenance protein MlaD [Sphingomonadaceae bacterium]MDW8414619.1 outer membrane lipid asymmetry maintenance protein MlaD [Thermaurantiacus sp.]